MFNFKNYLVLIMCVSSVNIFAASGAGGDAIRLSSRDEWRAFAGKLLVFSGNKFTDGSCSVCGKVVATHTIFGHFNRGHDINLRHAHRILWREHANNPDYSTAVADVIRYNDLAKNRKQGSFHGPKEGAGPVRTGARNRASVGAPVNLQQRRRDQFAGAGGSGAAVAITGGCPIHASIFLAPSIVRGPIHGETFLASDDLLHR